LNLGRLRRVTLAAHYSQLLAPTFVVHDLRHTCNVPAGEAGANLRELMDRMGHSSTRAALIYQHRTSIRDQMIADESL
jgi:integrase